MADMTDTEMIGGLEPLPQNQPARRSSSSVSEGEMPTGDLYTCAGKGGEYEVIGIAKGAGATRHVENLAVYRDTSNGALYFRAIADFDARMVPLPRRAATKAAAPADAPKLMTNCVVAQNSQKVAINAPAEDAREEVPELDVRYEFEKWMSDRGESAVYIGDGLYSRGAVCDQAEAFAAGVEIGKGRASSVPAIPGTGREKEWISVTDKLPDPNGTYLVASNWGVRAAYLHDPAWAQGCWQDALSKTDEGEMDFDYKQKGRFKVTHWMPLPDAPSHPSEAKAGEDA